MIEILLATYNGEKYLRQQLDSILAQDYQDFVITVRDDGSKDGTLDIIEEYIEKNPKKIRLLETETEYNSQKSNFAQLLANAQPDCYYCLCCQDDVWKPNKLSKQLTMMKQCEAMTGARTPVLVHSDMEIVDENLNVIEKSYVKYVNINPENTSLKSELCENSIVGVSCMFNMSLLMLCRNIPENAVSHDWWMAIHAVAVGKIGYIKEPLVQYRRHEGNTSGIVSGRGFDILKNLKNRRMSRFEIQKSYYQAQDLQKCSAGILNGEKMKMAAEYSSLSTASKFKRVITIICMGYCKKGIIGTIIQAING
ncbi:MAG: glycosyltransferase family 2 protein [Oscillospiraceae bacterium]|nr:glycosyltransferase family 2 protein [Oscillospiraceae bacterium]